MLIENIESENLNLKFEIWQNIFDIWQNDIKCQG